jgi:hypothetical protein
MYFIFYPEKPVYLESDKNDPGTGEGNNDNKAVPGNSFIGRRLQGPVRHYPVQAGDFAILHRDRRQAFGLVLVEGSP